MASEVLSQVSLACVLWGPVLPHCALTGMPRCVSAVGFGQHWVATCEGGEVVIFWLRVLGCLSHKPGPDKSHNDFSVTCGGSCVDGIESWWDLFIGQELER